MRGKGIKLLAAMAAAAMTVCTVVPAAPAEAASAAKVKSIAFSKPAVQTLALKKGETFRLKADVSPKKAKTNITYSSSRKKVVQVSKKGVLKAKKAGKATITAVSTTKPKKKASIKVTVYKKFTKVKNISIDKTSAVLSEGQNLTLNAAVSPAKATVKKVTYATSKKAVATVSKKGVVTAKKAGTAEIMAYAQDGRGARAVCRVTVQEKGGVTGSTAPGTTPVAPRGYASGLGSINPDTASAARPVRRSFKGSFGSGLCG